MKRVFNFSAGPAMLPESVLSQAAREMLDWNGSGMSVMEMSHRGSEFVSIHANAEHLLRTLLNIPPDYRVLFLQGGAIAQNAVVPMNLLRGRASADYVDTGQWSLKSIKEAGKYCQVNVAASSRDTDYSGIPPQSSWNLDPGAAYVHICSNETVGGVEYHWIPETGDVPLVADMSSNILSRPVDVARYGLIYCGAQKNIGPAGLTIVIVRDDLIGNPLPATPSAFDYKLQAENDSMLNTPSTFAIYIAGLVFQWLHDQGGLKVIEERNRYKASLLYDYIDSSSMYFNPVTVTDRSQMNVPFRLRDDAMDGAFLAGAEVRNLLQLKGHRSVGGMRASIYNAMPISGVESLILYMREFEKTHG